MNVIRALYAAAVDALFPVSQEEAALRVLTPEEAVRVLPPSPSYGQSVVPLPGVRSVFAYKDPRVARLIACIKNKNDPHAMRIGGYALWDALRSELGHRIDRSAPVILVPIAVTNRRRRERGYNQCEVLIDEIIRLDADGVFAAETRLLVRSRNRSEQKLKDRAERLEDATGIFSIDEEKAVAPHGRTLVVVDDVLTTGSTLKAAMDTLRAAGFTDVRGITLAH